MYVEVEGVTLREVDIAEFLAFLASFFILGTVHPQGQPIVTDVDKCGCHAPTSSVHFTNSSVYLIQDALYVIFVNELQQWP